MSSMGNTLGFTGINPSTEKTSKLEFAVPMTCQKCTREIRQHLEGVPGIADIDFDLQRGSVIVESSLPSVAIQRRIEASGRSAVLRGVGGTGKTNLGAAVAMLGAESGFSPFGVTGVVRFAQVDESSCVVDGTLDGLTPGKHGLHVHECGDISKGFESIGDHFNPLNTEHGGPSDDEKSRHVGDLGNVTAGADGRAMFRITDSVLKVWDVIGRSIAVTELEDDLGCGANPSSKKDGNSGQRLACGIIARSAGIFENSKKICACDGVTIWDERNKPLAGKGRQQQPSNL